MAYKVFAEDVCAPFTHVSFYSLAQLSKKAEKFIGIKSQPPLQEFIGTNVHWCLEEKNALALAETTVKNLEKPVYSEILVKESHTSLKKLNQLADLTKDKSFTNYRNRQLSNYLKKYLNVWIEATVWGHIVNMSDFYFNFLSDKILKLVEEKVKKEKIKISPVEIFTVMTTPTKRSILLEQEIDIFKLSKEIKKKKIKDFSNWQPLQSHTKKYDWLQYHYLGPTILKKNYFIEILKGLIKQRVSPDREIAKIVKREKETIKKQRELKKKINFNQKELYWLKLAREFVYLKGLRKEITFIASRSYDSLLKEIAKRFVISVRQLQFMSPDEIFDGLAGKKIPAADLLNQRTRYCALYYPQGKAKIYVGQEAEKLVKMIKEEKINKNIKEIKGATGYPGKVKGKVAIIAEEKEMKKMEKGMILVSPATNPNIMLAIVKAAAIVTDEGGITCHAAIVSRELKIPCVIGTKIATKVLKDGDMVEVDATKGVVRIIKKS